MPKRQITTKADSKEVQGKGSWVKYKAPTVAAFRDFRKEISSANERAELLVNSIKSLQVELYNLSNSVDENLTADEQQKVIKRLSSEIETFKEKLDAANSHSEKINIDFMSEYIVEWNWVSDEAGEILFTQPLNNPDVFYELTTPETKFLAELFNPIDAKKKRR